MWLNTTNGLRTAICWMAEFVYFIVRLICIFIFAIDIYHVVSHCFDILIFARLSFFYELSVTCQILSKHSLHCQIAKCCAVGGRIGSTLDLDWVNSIECRQGSDQVQLFWHGWLPSSFRSDAVVTVDWIIYFFQSHQSSWKAKSTVHLAETVRHGQ